MLFLAVLLLYDDHEICFHDPDKSTGAEYYFGYAKSSICPSVALEDELFRSDTSRHQYYPKTITNDLETLNSVFSEGLIIIIADILALISVLLVMLYTSVKLTIICLISFPFLLLASYLFKEKVKSSFQRVRQEVTKMNTFLQEHISGMKIVQIFNAQANTEKKKKSIENILRLIWMEFFTTQFFSVVGLFQLPH